MPRTNVFIPGFSGTAVPLDNSQFDIKFTKSIQQLESGLSKAQKSLGLFYNGNQQLNDAIGRCVEGLSLWQIRLGMWVDETGRARTVAGGFADGLSRTELELGYSVNNLGEVCKKTGEYVRLTKDAIQAKKEEEKALYQTREAFADAFDALGNGAGRMASLLTQFEGLNEEADGLRYGLARIAGSIDVASQAFSSFQNLKTGFKEAKTAVIAFQVSLSTSTTAAQGLKAAVTAIGGPWTVLVGGVLAAASALLAFKTTAKEIEDISIDGSFGEKVSDSFKEIARRAKEAGDSIKYVGDALKYGAFYKTGNELEEAQKKVDQTLADFDKLAEKATGIRSMQQHRDEFGGTNEGVVEFALKGPASKKEKEELKQSLADYDEALAEYNSIAQNLMETLRDEQKTEEEKANELKSQYETLLSYAESDEDRAAIERKIKSIDEDIAESKAKELADQQKRLADQRDALAKELGISLDFSAVQTEADRLAADLQRLRDARKDGLIESEEDLKEAERRLAEKYSEARYADWLASADSLDRLSEITEELAGEQEKGVLSQETYNKILADAAAKEQELVDAKLEAIPGLKALIDANDAEKKAAEDYAKALKIAEEYSEESPFDKGDVFSQEQLDILKNGEDETLRSAMIEYASAMEAAAQGLEDEVIDRETYDELVNRANDNLAKATDALEHEPDNSKEFQPPNKNRKKKKLETAVSVFNVKN